MQTQVHVSAPSEGGNASGRAMGCHFGGPLVSRRHHSAPNRHPRQALAAMVRLELPHVNVLTKVDLLQEKDKVGHVY